MLLSELITMLTSIQDDVGECEVVPYFDAMVCQREANGKNYLYIGCENPITIEQWTALAVSMPSETVT